MFTSNFIAGQAVSGSGKYFKAFNPATLTELEGDFEVATEENVEAAVKAAVEAFRSYKNTSPGKKAEFLRTIADEIEALGDSLLERASAESGLPIGRFKGERGRTVGQLRMFAKVIEEGSWVEARIDEAIPDRTPIPRVDIRNMLQPIGPVVVFGASNFPLAFSTAGGDTASALAAGCSVIVKVHPSHPGTNAMVAGAMNKAIQKCNLHPGLFSCLYDDGYAIGTSLVKHPKVMAVGFTGSEKGGKALMDIAAAREFPIPVYAEMGSTNPIFILKEKLATELDSLPGTLASSVNMGVGQFCTNPGLLFVIEDENLDTFVNGLGDAFSGLKSYTMLSEGIYKNYITKREASLATTGVQSIQSSDVTESSFKAPPAVARVSFDEFVSNPNLHEEVFGPFTMMVVCENKAQMMQLAQGLKGQLTSTILGTDKDFKENLDLIDTVKEKVGRLVFNGVPTGVEVGNAMHHGGPFPATSNARYTSVGTGAIKRFARPVAWQNCPEDLLPDALKSDNPLGIWRMFNGEMTK